MFNEATWYLYTGCRAKRREGSVTGEGGLRVIDGDDLLSRAMMALFLRILYQLLYTYIGVRRRTRPSFVDCQARIKSLVISTLSMLDSAAIFCLYGLCILL